MSHEQSAATATRLVLDDHDDLNEMPSEDKEEEDNLEDDFDRISHDSFEYRAALGYAFW